MNILSITSQQKTHGTERERAPHSQNALDLVLTCQRTFRCNMQSVVIPLPAHYGLCVSSRPADIFHRTRCQSCQKKAQNGLFLWCLLKKIEERNGHAKYIEKIVKLSTSKKKKILSKNILWF